MDAFTAKVKDMQGPVAEAEQLQTGEVKDEEELGRRDKELEVVSGQAAALKTERDALREELKASHDRVAWRHDQLKVLRKDLRKPKKILILTEDRCYQFGFDEVVRNIHAQGWDHKLLLEEGDSDPVSRVDPDEPLVVSSGEDEPSSN